MNAAIRSQIRPYIAPARRQMLERLLAARYQAAVARAIEKAIRRAA